MGEKMKKKQHIYSNYVKRVFDFFLALLALFVFGIPMLLIAVLVKIKLGSPVFFKQDRPGKGGKVFQMYKFRSMTDERGEDGELLPDEVRLTSFGRVLRSTSLDELPELLNVLKGDMSFIGPRPLLVRYLPLYNERQRRRHEVKPGITGYAQVNGRNAISWEEKFEKDVWYVENISFWTDIKILFKTVAVVFGRKGISSDTAVTMEEFKGSIK